MHNREYTVFLRPYKGGMMLHTMYYKDEVRDLDNFGRPDVELKDAEVKVAHQLIEALSGEFEPEKYKDTFEENLKTLIKARLEGEEVTTIEKPRKPAPVVDLMAALKESLAQMPKKPPQRVEAAQRESEIRVVGKGTPAKKSRRKPAA
jgi:DNA end-binding protein Ku